MRANARNTPTTTGYLALTFITLFGLILGGCGAPAAPEPTTAPEAAEAEIIEAPTLPPPPPTPVLSETVGATEVPPTPTPVPIMLDDLAAEIAEEVGVVTTVVETEAEPVIFVFEERHDSVLGQIEIAIMLNRLYTDHNLRHIGLEGHMADEEPLDLAWAHREPYYQPDQIITNREDVMTQTLQEGEIGSAELIGLVYHDVVVDGIDDAGLYAFDPPEEAWDAPDLYLYYIALAGMSDANRITWQALYDAEQYDAAFEFALGSDEFTSEMREKLSDPVDIVSIEEWLTALDELQAQAEAVEADLTEEHAASLEAMGEYFEHVSQRSGAMVAAALDLAAAYPEAPLAMTIGALHTARVVELLTDAGVSFAVIRPLSLAEGDTAGLLSAEAYQRKQQGLSVAPDGWLGSYLDGRRKPPPVVDQERYEIEEMVRELAQELAQEAKFMYHYVESPEELKSFLQGFLDEVLSNDFAYMGIFYPATVTVVKVIPPENSDAGPTVEFRIDYEGFMHLLPQSLIIRASTIGGTHEKPQVTLVERLTQARDEVKTQATISEESTEEGGETRIQMGCSNTAISVIEVGG